MAVWTFDYNPDFRYMRSVDRSRVDLGKGFTKTVIHSPLVSRADGTGSVSSYRGQNIFNITVHFRETTEARNILSFLQSRIDEGDAAFQFYWVEEREVDNTGSATTGMYWVKCLNDIEDVVNASFHHEFMNLTFEEDLSSY